MQPELSERHFYRANLSLRSASMANKLDIDDATATATEKALLSDSLAAVKKQAAELDETRWLYEDMPATPEALEASAGL